MSPQIDNSLPLSQLPLATPLTPSSPITNGANKSNSSAASNSVDPNLQLFQSIVNSALISRNQFISEILGKRKNIDAECDYPEQDSEITPNYYETLYEREPVPRRVVTVLPVESWQVMPEIFEVEDGEKTTEFEEALMDLPKNMQDGESYHEDRNLSLIWKSLKEGDIESRKGHYGGIYIGLDDGKDPSTPAVYNPNQKLVWMIALSEKYCRVESINDNIASARFGLPETYSVSFEQRDGTYLSGSPGANVTSASKTVHWSRIVHVSEGRVYHTPAMKPVLNRLLDLRKLYAGSAEMYWRGAFPGIAFETIPDLAGDADLDLSASRNSIEAYFNGLQRYFSLNGMTAKSLDPQVVDPSRQIEVQIVAICIELGIPMRIFMGSERGQLASSQDDAQWNDRLRERQNSYLTPRIVAPFINRLISLGVLPKPKKGFKVYWPDMTSQTDEAKSSRALKLMQSLAQYLSSGGDIVITPYDFLTTVWKLDDKQSLNIIERARKQLEETNGMSQFQNPTSARSSSPPNNASQLPNGEPNPNKPANSTISIPSRR